MSLFERIHVRCRKCAPARVEQLSIAGHRKTACEGCGYVFEPMEQAVHYMGPLVEPPTPKLEFRPKISDFELLDSVPLRSGSKVEVDRSGEIVVKMRTDAVLTKGQAVKLIGPTHVGVGADLEVKACGVVHDVQPGGIVWVALRP